MIFRFLFNLKSVLMVCFPEIKALFHSKRNTNSSTQETIALSEMREEDVMRMKRELVMEFNRFHSKWVDELGNVHSFHDKLKLIN